MTITRALLISFGIIIILVLIIAGLFFLNKSGTITLPENSFFPSASDDGFPIDNNTQTGIEDDFQDSINVNTPSNTFFARAAQITQKAIVGAIFTQSINGDAIRYMEKETGYIYDFDIATRESERVSNKTIENVKKVIWGKNGNEFIVQTITDGVVETVYYSFDSSSARFFFTETLSIGDNNEDVRLLQRALNEDPATLVAFDGVGSPKEESSFYGEKTKDAVIRFQEKYKDEILSPQQIEEGTGIFDSLTKNKLNKLFAIPETVDKETRLSKKILSDGIQSIVSSPDQSRIFYLENMGDYVVGIISDLDGSNQKEIITSLFHEWTPYFSSPDTIVFTTRPSAGISGISYAINIDTGIVSRLIGEINGLTTLINNDNTKILYSKSDKNTQSFTTNILDIQTQDTEISSLTTLPEKCAWGINNPQLIYCGVPSQTPTGTYPDDWYKGKVSFSDLLWSYDTDAKQQNVLVSFSTEFAQDVDIIEPQINENETSFIFTNKKDLSLWLVRLK